MLSSQYSSEHAQLIVNKMGILRLFSGLSSIVNKKEVSADLEAGFYSALTAPHVWLVSSGSITSDIESLRWMWNIVGFFFFSELFDLISLSRCYDLGTFEMIVKFAF